MRPMQAPDHARERVGAFLRWVATDVLPVFGTVGEGRPQQARTDALGEAPPQISYQPFRLPDPEGPDPHAGGGA